MELTQIEKLGADIDLRLMWLWQEIIQFEGELNYVILASWLRAAYGQGYIHAQTEPFGKLQIDNGYNPPTRIDE